MFKQYSAILALTATAGLLQVGHGALGALVVQQGGRLQFSITVLGMLSSATFIGFLASNLLLYRLLPRISFIRTFSICAVVMTALVLLMPMLPAEGAWLLLRFLYGVFFSAAVIVCDGWLNASATNKNRGKFMGMFMTVNYLLFGMGQYILLVGREVPTHAFMLTAIIMALCLVPMCMTRFSEPQTPARGDRGLSWRDAYAIAPVSLLGQFGFGAMTGATFLFINYVEGLDMSAGRQATLAALLFGSGFLLQMPMGWLADKVSDRRDIMIGVAGISAVLAVLLCLGEVLSYAPLALLIVAFGSVSTTLFSLNIAYGQSFVEREKSAAYSGVLFRVYALGALLGAPLAGFLMDAVASLMLFVVIGAILGGITLMTATNRLMPRYRPASQEQFRPASPLAAVQPGTDDEVYFASDIGPDLPAADMPAAAGVAEIGPDVPAAVVLEQSPDAGTITPNTVAAQVDKKE